MRKIERGEKERERNVQKVPPKTLSSKLPAKKCVCEVVA